MTDRAKRIEEAAEALVSFFPFPDHPSEVAPTSAADLRKEYTRRLVALMDALALPSSAPRSPLPPPGRKEDEVSECTCMGSVVPGGRICGGCAADLRSEVARLTARVAEVERERDELRRIIDAYQLDETYVPTPALAALEPAAAKAGCPECDDTGQVGPCDY